MIDEQAVRKQAEVDGITHFATGIAVFQDGKLLVVRRAGTDDFLGGEWELPGGGVDVGESIQDGAIRELLEETGLTIDTVIGTFQSFDYSTPRKPKVRQINFKVTVLPHEVQLDPTEHDKFRWIVADDIPELKTNEVMQGCLRNSFR